MILAVRRSASEPVLDPAVLGEAFDPYAHKGRLGDILVSAGLLSEEQRDAALAEKDRMGNTHLGEILVKLGYASEEVVARVWAAQLRIPFVRLREKRITPPILDLVDGQLAYRHRCIPIDASINLVTLAMANPFDLVAIEDVELASCRRVDPVAATPSDIGAAIERYYCHDIEIAGPKEPWRASWL